MWTINLKKMDELRLSCSDIERSGPPTVSHLPDVTVRIAINGRDLGDIIADVASRCDARAGDRDRIQVFSGLSPKQLFDEISGKRRHDPEHVMLGLCAHCGHPGCASYGASIHRESDAIIWSEFYIDGVYSPVDLHFAFPVEEYEHEMARLRLRALR